MTVTSIAVVTVAGAVGALLRHELTTRRRLAALHVVNVVGSLLLGVALALGLRGLADLATVAGLGALTSFSTWMAGAVDEAGRPDSVTASRRAARIALHVVGPAVAAVGAAATGVAATLVLTEGVA